MKRILIGTIVVLAFFVFYIFLNKESPFVEYKLNNKSYKLLIAKNDSEWQKGLMNYRDKKELKGAEGMMFVFPNKDLRSFWNMNTYLDLDVYWLDGDRIVGKGFLPSIEKSKDIVTIDSPGKVDRVIELIRKK